MPSFDVVSEVDQHELTNAVDQCNREILTRFDFKGSNAAYALKEAEILMTAPNEFQIKQMQEILKAKLAKRAIDIRCLDLGDILTNLSEARQTATIKQGIDKELAKKITKVVKDSKVKVTASIQGEQVRVTGKIVMICKR